MCMIFVCAAHALANAATGPESESQVFEPAISGITVVTAQTLLYNSKHAVLMFCSWPEPLL